MSIDDQDYTLHKKRSEPYEPCIKPNIFGEYEEKFRELRDRIEKLEKEKGLTPIPYYPPQPYYPVYPYYPYYYYPYYPYPATYSLYISNWKDDTGGNPCQTT